MQGGFTVSSWPAASPLAATARSHPCPAPKLEAFSEDKAPHIPLSDPLPGPLAL